jgi:6-hydroxycyclohex-1-ene-1-carbonyl-CoA dehydrogenase
MHQIKAYRMTAKDAPFELITIPIAALQPEEAVVEVAGCGVCHTDLSFWHYGVPTRHALPLVLGHEIAGTVVEGPARWIGKPTIVPAVIPCGECDLCRGGRGNICQKQQMPGNDFNGGFASHVVVPARFLAPVPEAALERHSLAELAVIADAVSTPYQVIVKSGLKTGDLAIVIGVGGIGGYAALLARIFGAKVLAIDIDQAKLDSLCSAGIEATLNVRGLEIKEIKNRVKSFCRDLAAPPHGWKIFETSGTRAGQELAFALLGIAGTLSVVGFTMDKLEIRLSNLMAFDATIIGTWGCKAELYPEVIALVAENKLSLRPFTETQPMSHINDVFRQILEHKLLRRVVLTPDF